jgi:hypothetical protein
MMVHGEMSGVRSLIPAPPGFIALPCSTTEEVPGGMSPKRTLKAEDILRDLRAGMTDSALMRKYFLSSRGLHSILDKLLDAKVLTKEQLVSHRRGFEGDDTVDVEPTRLLPRDMVEFPLPLYDARNQQIKAWSRMSQKKAWG